MLVAVGIEISLLSAFKLLKCSSGDDDDAFTDKNSCIDFLNKSSSCIEESPVRKKRIMQDSNYCKRKLEKAK